MIRFPLFEHLTVDGYGLYPGTDDSRGLQATFAPGLTLVLGANGLGKSTLVLLLYRMCTGTTDLPEITGRTELGSRQLNASPINNLKKRTFAARVHDGAADARATLDIRFGSTLVSITRDLNNLSLRALEIDRTPSAPTEENFQEQIVSATGVSSFVDWILILRYLVFYFEDRRSLVWDPSAQRQVLRLLFVPPDTTDDYLGLESDILKDDTYSRNLSAALSRQENYLRGQERIAGKKSEVKRRIAALASTQEDELRELSELTTSLNQADADRQSARLDALRASEERENAYRAVEHRRLLEIQAAFPSYKESAAYILTHILAGNRCLVCGTDVPDFANELTRRIDHAECIICSSPVSAQPSRPDDQSKDIDQALADLKLADERVQSTSTVRQEAEHRYREALSRIQVLETATSRREVEIDELVRQLPDSDQKIRQRRSEFRELRSQVETARERVRLNQAKFAELIDDVNLQISTRQEQVKREFNHHAYDFLLESCALAWGSHRQQVGQSGKAIEFGVFEVDMTGTDFTSPVRRSGSDQVSESQREFIDLAFRMALIAVAGEGNVGTLVMDAPESSLDAVFSPRAATVLTQFGQTSRQNRVILTSNLVDGRLIPTLLRQAGIHGKSDPRIVDLFKIAAPTAALKTLRSDYDQALDRLFGEAGS